MPDPVSEASESEPASPTRRRITRLVVEAVATVAIFAAAGAAAGWLWFRIWDPPPGVVIQNEWFPDPWDSGQRSVFTATVGYVVIAVLLGLVLGAALSLLFHRAELVTLAAVVVGSALAAWLMYEVGVQLSPSDPQVFAESAADETRLPGSLMLPGKSPFLALPVGSLIGLGAAYLMSSGVGEIKRLEASDSQWLARNHPG